MYGLAEAIEDALFTKLEKFPKVALKEHHKLRELSDLLSEIESVKQEGYLPGLSYLDTARGISPIVEKLPYGLQDKWMMEGSRYKQEHKVDFPPFHFTQFIRNQAKACNDPSFNLLSVSNTVNRSRFVESHGKGQRSLSVHKTEVFPSSNSTSSVEGPDKFCPVHHKPHPLRRCRGFRKRPIDERSTISALNAVHQISM